MERLALRDRDLVFCRCRSGSAQQTIGPDMVVFENDDLPGCCCYLVAHCRNAKVATTDLADQRFQLDWFGHGMIGAEFMARTRLGDRGQT